MTMSANANVVEWLATALPLVTGSIDRPGGMWFNPGVLARLDESGVDPQRNKPAQPGPPSRPELPRRFGQYPCAALAGEIEAGNLRVLLSIAGNPLTSFPDSKRLAGAAENLDVLAVADLRRTPTVERATHVLPCTGPFERPDATLGAELYQPEWVLTGWNLQDVVLFARLYDQQQWAHAFGPGDVSVLLPAANYESGAKQGSIWYWQYGDRAPKSGTGSTTPMWQIAAFMFPCLQLAGPHLTPQAFRDGCFANPAIGGSYCGCTTVPGVLLGDRPGVPWKSYSAWDDMTDKWWDPNQQGTDEEDRHGPPAKGEGRRAPGPVRVGQGIGGGD